LLLYQHDARPPIRPELQHLPEASNVKQSGPKAATICDWNRDTFKDPGWKGLISGGFAANFSAHRA
jgi:hypothetical protein